MYMILKELLAQYEIDNNMTPKEVAKQLGVSTSTYYRWLSGESTMLKKSTIRKLTELLDCDVEAVIEETNRVKPILGNVRAGYDLYAEQDIDGYVEVGHADSQKGDYFLRVTGDSMEGVHIFEGDLVYVQQCTQVRSGSIAIVLIGDEATIKRVRYKNDLMILEAANPKYEARIFSAKEVEELPVKILGLVRFVRTDFV